MNTLIDYSFIFQAGKSIILKNCMLPNISDSLYEKLSADHLTLSKLSSVNHGVWVKAIPMLLHHHGFSCVLVVGVFFSNHRAAGPFHYQYQNVV